MKWSSVKINQGKFYIEIAFNYLKKSKCNKQHFFLAFWTLVITKYNFNWKRPTKKTFKFVHQFMGGNTERIQKMDTQKRDIQKQDFLLRDSDATQKLNYRKDAEPSYHSFMYSLYHFFWYLCIICNAFIACFIICEGICKRQMLNLQTYGLTHRQTERQTHTNTHTQWNLLNLC